MNPASPTQRRKRERVRPSSCLALTVANLDQVREAQLAAYQEQRAELERLSKTLQRYRETDTPRFSQWVREEFAELIQTSYELGAEVQKLENRVQNVLNYAICAGLDERHAFWALEKARAAGTEEALWNEAMRKDTAPPAQETLAEYAPNANDEPPSRLKSLYRQIVRLLHPDRIADPQAFDRRTWQDVQEAYRRGDLSRLEQLFEAAKVGQAAPSQSAEAPIDDLLTMRRDAERAMQSIKAELKRAKANPAWRFHSLLKDKWRLSVLRGQIAEELASDIAELEKKRERCERKLAAWYRSRPPR